MHLLFLAGIGNSGPDHWQHQWYMESENTTWLEHSDWDNPVMEEWLGDLNAALDNIAEPVVVIAHSLGSVLFTEWLRRTDKPEKIAGAMLVAIPDVFDPHFPAQVLHFSNLSTPHACCPAVVIASENDPYASAEYAHQQGNKIDALFYNIGPVGHINHQSGLNGWSQGKAILHELIERISSQTCHSS